MADEKALVEKLRVLSDISLEVYEALKFEYQDIASIRQDANRLLKENHRLIEENRALVKANDEAKETANNIIGLAKEESDKIKSMAQDNLVVSARTRRESEDLKAEAESLLEKARKDVVKVKDLSKRNGELARG